MVEYETYTIEDGMCRRVPEPRLPVRLGPPPPSPEELAAEVRALKLMVLGLESRVAALEAEEWQAEEVDSVAGVRIGDPADDEHCRTAQHPQYGGVLPMTKKGE